MSEVNAIFTLNCVDTKVQCKRNEKMKDICQRFSTKIEKDMNSYIYLYGGTQLHFELTFEEHLQDKGNKEMAISVFKKEDYVIKCIKCGEKLKLNKDKLDEIILNNNNIKDKINGIESMIDNMIKTSLINTMNNQLKSINVSLNHINDDIKKNNERLEILLDTIIMKDDDDKYKNMITGTLDINTEYINKHIHFYHNEMNYNIEVYINNEKLKNNKFENEGKYSFKIIFNDIVTNMKSFFSNCLTITSLDFSNFNTFNITDMSFMFNECYYLKEIKGLNKFITNKVRDMNHMFEHCHELEYLDLSSFDTSKVTNMGYMFNQCHKLKEIKGLNKFITNRVKGFRGMIGMFQLCEELEYLDLSNFDTSKVDDMSWMFSNCNKLKYLNLLNFTIIKKCNTEKMFNFKNKKNCQLITNNKDLLKIYESS